MADVAARSKNVKRPKRGRPPKSHQEPDGEGLEDDDPLAYGGGYDGAPEVGMIFKDHVEVTSFYKRYARRIGFWVAVRRSAFTPEGQCLFLELSCGKAGRKRPEPKFKKRALSSTNCLARIRVKLWGDGLLHLEVANLDHNHPLSPSMARFLNCIRSPASALTGRKHMYDGPEGIPQLPGEEDTAPFDRFGGLGELLFGECEHRSFVDRGKLRLFDGDAEALRLFFTRMKAKNSNFFHVVDLDDEGCIRNVFWADAWSRAAYEYYGDVVSLDTSYITTKFDIPLALFIGTNHHGHPVLLGCGLLSDETVDTYVWLLKVWLACMSGRLPGAVITDQSRNIQSAISEVLPRIRHRFCLGQIMKRVSEKLGNFSEFRVISKVFQKAVFDSLRREDFEKDWLRMMEIYGFQGIEWLRYLYDSRNQWVPVFLKDTFWAGMSITQRNESMSAFFDGYVDPKTTIKQFLLKYEAALQSKFDKEAQADFETFHKRRPAVSKFLMEEQLSQVYTLNLFKQFQDEVEQIMYCHALPVNEDGPVSTFEVQECVFLEDGKNTITKDYGVLYNAEEKEVQCICGLFQLRGILCRHALSVFKLQQVHEIPPKYVLDRWKKDFRKLQVMARSSEDIVPKNREGRSDYLTMRCLELVETGMVSEKYQLALKLLREVEKFILSDKIYEDTQPKIVPVVPKDQIADEVKKIATTENASNKKIVPPQPPKGKKVPKEKQGAKLSQDEQSAQPAQAVGASQVPLVMPKGMNQGYIFQFVPTMPPLRPPEGGNPGAADAPPVTTNPQPFVGNQIGAQPSFVYMMPGGVDPKAFGNRPMVPWYYPQMYQTAQQPLVPSIPGSGEKVKRRKERTSLAARPEAGKLKESCEQEEIVQDEEADEPLENSGGGGDEDT